MALGNERRVMAHERPILSVPGPHDIVRHEFDNGIVALVRENHTSLTVAVGGYVRVGAIDVTAEQAGLAAFTAAALMRGTEKRSFGQIYEEIESVGAAAHFGGGGHTTSFGAKSLAEDFPLVLDILVESTQRPTFPTDEIERLRGQILTALEMRANDTGAMAGLAFRSLAYANGHPYGRSVRGYPETIRSLTREEVRRFYQQGYGAQGMVICIVGAVNADDVLNKVEDAFRDWQGGTFIRAPLPNLVPLKGVLRKRVDMPKKIQTDIVMGLPGPARAEPDFLDAGLANHILGVFGMMGRLGRHLRDEQGLAYSIYSRLEGGLGPGPWTVVAGLDPANVERAISGARAEIRLLRDVLVESDELADIQTNIIGSLPLSLETNEGVVAAILNMERHQLGLDYLLHYADCIRKITPERIQRAARRWLDPDNLAIGIAGPPVE